MTKLLNVQTSGYFRSLSLALGLAACSGQIGDNASSPPGDDDDNNPPSPPGDDNDDPEAPNAGLGPCEDKSLSARVWRLSAAQYAATVETALGGRSVDLSKAPPDAVDARTGFSNGQETTFVSNTFANTLFTAAEQAADGYAQSLAQKHPCMVQTPVSDQCLNGFVNDLGLKLFRRPVAEAETNDYLALYRRNQSRQDAQSGGALLLHALLLSPNAVYRTELGDGTDERMTGFEIAAAIAYGLGNDPPGEALMEAAREGRLFDAGVRKEFAREIAKTSGAGDKVSEFMAAQLQVHKLNQQRNALGEKLVDAMIGETNLFAREIFASSQPTLEQFYLAPVAFVNDALAPIYKLSQKPSTLTRVEVPEDERFGIFTQPSWLAASHGPVHRGKLIREAFLCQDISLPPANAGELINQLPATPKEYTQAEKWPAFVEERAGCAACHSTFEPLGFAFETYDSKGTFRKENEYGRFIDPAFKMTDVEGWSGEWQNGRDMVQQIASSQVGQNCFTQRFLTFAMGQGMGDAVQSCTTRRVGRAFIESGGNVHDLLAAIVADDHFIKRVRNP
ncbi:MAG: DUF1588 domain-containing protein [Deltaproteobacteria bacterium]|nr:DUF1588 domain-containing protein [Deltaproteobacteria bacterium]